jgi:signal transduction histidine kinase
VWGRFAYIVGLFLALCAFGGFTFRIGEGWGFGRARHRWDTKAFLSLPLTSVLIIATGYLGSFIVLVPGAQTFESLKDLVVLTSIVLLGYPALIAVPFAYGLSDLIEGVPPEFLLAWLPGYFINPSCFWIAYQFFGKNPDFRIGRTWGRYLAAAVLFMTLEPVLWGYVCSDQFPSGISYYRITPALFFTTSITWMLGPLAFLVALPLARRFGWFWAEIPGRVKERALGGDAWIWESGRGETRGKIDRIKEGLPIRIFIFAPFIALMLVMVGVTAVVVLRSADDDSAMLATRLHQQVATNIRMQLDGYLERSPSPADAEREGTLASLLRSQAVGTNGRAFILDRSGKMIASSAPTGDPVVESAVAALAEHTGSSGAAAEFKFDHVTAKPLSRQSWLTYATPYRDETAGHDWILIVAMPESFYLGGLQVANSRAAMVFALALVLSLVLAAVLAALVATPLQRMARATRTLAAGDLSTRVPGSKLEELDALAQSFNDMAARLKTSFEAMQQAQAEVARVARLTTMGELAGSIAHEINQPLAAVVTNANAALRWLVRDPPNLDETKAALGRMIKDGNRASDVIMHIRELLKHRTPEHVEVDINEAIREILEIAMGALRSRAATAHTALASGVPLALGDRVQLQQVIMNLIMNGADAMSSVTDRPRILSIGSKLDDNGHIHVTVRDSGTGIDEAIQHRIFEPLFTTKNDGMGMGLSICRSIIEAHGGRLWASPATPHGTEFQFTIPRAIRKSAFSSEKLPS